jgi:hypothetical protein
MTVNIDKELFVVSPAGPLLSIDEFIFCPDRASADKEVEAELDLSGQRMVVLKCRISIPMKLEGGNLIITDKPD